MRRIPSSCVVVFVVVLVTAASVFAATATSTPPAFHGRRSHHGVPFRAETLNDFQWLDQKLDQFNFLDHRTFKQRYWVDTSNWSPSNGPVFLYFCGEAECGGVPGGFLQQMAKEYRAMIAVLEHRYYGASQPFATWDTPNLVYLNSRQALADMAYFRMFIAQTYSVSSSSHWVSVGGSYPGALTAWFREKFPHLVDAAWSSSGVVNAVFDFTMFDTQIQISAGPECAAALRNATQQVENLLRSSPATNIATKSRFGAAASDFPATDIGDGDFYFLLADASALPFQYGYPDKICPPMVAAARSGGDLVGAFATVVQSFFLPQFCAGVGARSYSTVLQQVVTPTNPRDERQWWWQTCSELAYWQTPPKTNSIRSQYLTLDSYHQHCNAVFGTDVWPNTDIVNNYYGATNIASRASNILFANASQDPWQWASVRPPTVNSSNPTAYLQCYNCGHCGDLRGCPGGCTDPNALTSVQNQIRGWLGGIFKTPRNTSSSVLTSAAE